MQLSLKKISSFWFAPADLFALAIFRMLLGTLCLCLYLALSPHWYLFFSREELAIELPGRINIFSWLSFVGLNGVWWLAILSSFCLILGFGTRIATLLLFLVQSSMLHTNRFVANGEDLVLRYVLLYAIFACLSGKLSLDAAIRNRLGLSSPTGRVWPVRLIQINTLLVYALSLPVKLSSDPAWLTGDFMYYTLVNTTWSRFPFSYLATYWPVTAIMTYTTIVAEGLFPIIVWFKHVRFFAVVCMIGLHLSIAIVLQNVGFFSFAMIVALTSFLTEKDFSRIVKLGFRR